MNRFDRSDMNRGDKSSQYEGLINNSHMIDQSQYQSMPGVNATVILPT